MYTGTICTTVKRYTFIKVIPTNPTAFFIIWLWMSVIQAKDGSFWFINIYCHSAASLYKNLEMGNFDTSFNVLSGLNYNQRANI